MVLKTLSDIDPVFLVKLNYVADKQLKQQKNKKMFYYIAENLYKKILFHRNDMNLITSFIVSLFDKDFSLINNILYTYRNDVMYQIYNIQEAGYYYIR